MRLAALFSGGKDSAYSAYRAIQEGHTVACLVSAAPVSPDSMLFHAPNTHITGLQAISMGIPRICARSGPSDADSEEKLLAESLLFARDEYRIQGVVHGGLSSAFQKRHFEGACGSAGLEAVAPLWGLEPGQYMRSLVDDGFRFIITAVSAGGLGARWLGREIGRREIDELGRISARHGLGLAFEGGEAETLVVDCPLFSREIRILRSRGSWDGCRGIFEIEAAGLSRHARRPQDQPPVGNKKDSQLAGGRRKADTRAGARRPEGADTL
ncbi:ATPase of the PP-loop superfamily [Cenarchaeum symbiosum A]|uniref:ATPase of the PP-loop superfamily n=1 Tax=Cenarchaeum symbiosum (strain A) TaxID=414004 RepID=A0RUN8_CENSY|nr:ATPase of the PP-loop superfamily [Cenarchaeum symbiosum A]